MYSITIEQASVVYPVLNHNQKSLASRVKKVAIGGSIRDDNGVVSITALDNISVRINEGDRIGILGRNGAGKTTLLRLITGVYAPVGGRIEVKGQVSSLIDIQLGLNGNLNGDENIRLRSLYMGISRQEIEQKINEIADFSELGEYLDLPLNTYSSGMKIRLAFAVATGFEPDVMIMDEWMSAGDSVFRVKARERLLRLVDESKIFVIASQMPSLHRKLCTKGLVLDKGRVIFYGPIDEALDMVPQK